MARARLIGHVERLVIEPINRSGLAVDALADEPYGLIARSAQVTVRAQLDTSRENARVPGAGGARVPVAATATFLARDLTAAGWSPKDGDRVIEVQDARGLNPRTVNWYVSTCQFTGKTHYGSELVVVDLSDRPTSREPSEGLDL